LVRIIYNIFVSVARMSRHIRYICAHVVVSYSNNLFSVYTTIILLSTAIPVRDHCLDAEWHGPCCPTVHCNETIPRYRAHTFFLLVQCNKILQDVSLRTLVILVTPEDFSFFIIIIVTRYYYWDIRSLTVVCL